MVAALTFANLLPSLTVTDGQVDVGLTYVGDLFPDRCEVSYVASLEAGRRNLLQPVVDLRVYHAIQIKEEE